MNVAGLLEEAAQRYGERPALRLGDVVVTYAALEDASARVAGLLRDRGVGPGDRVGVMLPNVVQFGAVYYGVLRAGAVVVPMNVLLKAREVAYYLADPEASLLFAWHAFAAEAHGGAAEAGVDVIDVEPGAFMTLLADTKPAEDTVERDGADTAVILYTSGTTGTPKGAELTHANLTRNAEVARRLFSLGTDDVVFGGLPLFHSFGQTCSLNASLSAGASVALVTRFDPTVALDTLQGNGVTVFMGVPTMFSALLNHPERTSSDVSRLRLCVSGGASLPVEVLRGFEEAFECLIVEGYGLSETSPVASFNDPERIRKPGSIGTPVEGVEMKVIGDDGADLPAGEVGEIVIRGHNVMKGYWRRPEATANAISADGWFRTGDMARVDDDGYFFIVDRKKDMIIRGGYNVYPREIEEVLYEHKAVRECAVIGVPHPTLGEEVAAAVVLKDGVAATAEELREHVKAEVAAYKYPRHLWFVDELPKGPTGKILKRGITVPDDLP